MNIKNKKIIMMIIVIISAVILIPNMVQAGLQANKDGISLIKMKPNDLFIAIRKMETQYGTLGKSAILDTTTYLDSTGNGIDCHMALSTEFGTVGILAYSEYGVIPTESSDTTTGNESGVYQLGYGNGQYACGILTTSEENYMNVIAKADTRYYNKYDSKIPIAGDGMGKLGFQAYYPGTTSSISIRGGSGILHAGANGNYTYGNFSSRAVVVCGTGL